MFVQTGSYCWLSPFPHWALVLFTLSTASCRACTEPFTGTVSPVPRPGCNMRIGFLASHNGSWAKAITKACDDGILNASPTLLVSNNPDCPAFEWAKEFKLKTCCLNEKQMRGAENLDQQMAH